MERWSGRVALVTGASAGIGEAIVKELVLKGMKVVGVARRVERIEALQNELSNAPGKLYPLKCDVKQEADIVAAFEWVKKNLGGVDVLVNNAGVFASTMLNVVKSEDIRHIFDVNVIGLSICTREALKSMKERGVDDGHIIHVSSVAGHAVHNIPGIGIYTASKYGVTALTEALRKELVAQKSNIRVTSISPGLVKTEIMVASGAAPSLDVSDQIYDMMPHLKSEDLADSVIYVLGAPPHVQIVELTLTAVGEAS